MAQWINDPQGREEIEKVTKELKLPVWKANYKGKFRDFWNELWDKIEDGYLRLKESIAGKEPTILKKSGFNLDKTDSFEEDDTNKLATAKALKKLNDNVSNHSHDDRYYTETEIDNKLSEDIFHNTGKEYGGILNYSGNKIAGKTYFDNNTKKLFLCLKNNNNTSANTENFIPLDNNSLLDRLENLLKFREITLTKDLDRDLFSRYSGTIPSDIFPSKIINIILEEGSGAPAGYSIIENKITAFYFKYQLSATRKAKIIYC